MAPDSTFPGMGVAGAGRGFDQADEERVTFVTAVPFKWQAVDVYLWVFAETTGNASFHLQALGIDLESATLSIPSAYTCVRALIAESVPFVPTDMVPESVNSRLKVGFFGLIRDTGDTPGSGIVGRPAPSGNLAGDVTVSLVELARGSD